MSAESQLLEPRRILVVEDDPATSELVASRLRAHGLACQVVETGGEALASVAATAFDLLLLDLGLPDMNGMEVLTAVKRMPRPPAVVVMTAFGSSSVAHEVEQAGALFLLKPVRRQDLLDAIERALAARGA